MYSHSTCKRLVLFAEEILEPETRLARLPLEVDLLGLNLLLLLLLVVVRPFERV